MVRYKNQSLRIFPAMRFVEGPAPRSYLSVAGSLSCIFMAVSLCVAGEPSTVDHSPSAIQESGDSLMRIISPVRLTSELGAKLDSEVIRTRQVLGEFQKTGFGYAVWAVNKLPENEKDIPQWTKTCIKAFPGKIILALDSALHEQSSRQENTLPGSDTRMGGFLKASLLSSSVHSVIINFITDPQELVTSTETIAIAKENIQLVRDISKSAFIWLYVYDDLQSDKEIKELTADLNKIVDGYYVQHPHAWNAGTDVHCAEAGKPLLATGKPVIRGGFQYTCPRVRPGIESDIAQYYQSRIETYEKWLGSSRYAGYAREIGESIPNAISINMNFAGL